MTARFEGKTALITGAASGMGRAIVRRLADEGASVFALDVNPAGLDETLILVKDPPGRVTGHAADLADPANCTDAVRRCVAEYGRLDVLGNVAGIYIASHFAEMTAEQYRRIMAVNLDAYFYLAQAALPHLLATEGNIISIASNAGVHGVPYSVAYSMSKGGVVQMTRSLSTELLKTRVRVNAIAPAGTNTNISANTSFPPDADVDLLRRMVGFRGMAERDEVAALFAFMASDEARSITGAVYTLDNGLTAS